MNAMGHGVPTMIGVDHRGVAEKINKLLPDNTLPMMTGQGPFGPIEMGGMFTVVKIPVVSVRRCRRIGPCDHAFLP